MDTLVARFLCTPRRSLSTAACLARCFSPRTQFLQLTVLRVSDLNRSSESLPSVTVPCRKGNISTASLYKLCAQNQVAHVRVGNTIRFNPADVSILVGFMGVASKVLEQSLKSAKT